MKDTTIGDAFINIQKDQCGAVYASAADLKTLTAALVRNGAHTNSLTCGFCLRTLTEKTRRSRKRRKPLLLRRPSGFNGTLTKSALRACARKDLSATLAARQKALRDNFGESAQAAAGALSSEIIAWTKDQSGQIGTFYPAFAAWLADEFADHWESVTIDSGLEDFGASDFKTRTLDTVFSRITLHMKSRMLGEYKDFCFIFGRINDTEFDAERASLRSMRR